MKTFVKYPGGKTSELKIINKNKPEKIDRFFEPFVGGGSVFFNLEIKKSYINDLSTDLISLYRFIKEKDFEFLSKLNKLNETWKNITPNNYQELDLSFLSSQNLNLFFENVYEKEFKNRKLKNGNEQNPNYEEENLNVTAVKAAFYYTIRQIYNTEKNNPISNAISYYFMREFCYSSMFRFSTTGMFNVPYGGQSYNNKTFDSKIDLINSYDICNTKLYNEDFERFISRFKFKADDFVFVDPPYDSEFCNYDRINFDKNEQKRLANLLSKLPAKIMIVIKNTDFIYNLYQEKGFNISFFDKKYNVNFLNRNIRDVKHLIIRNY